MIGGVDITPTFAFYCDSYHGRMGEEDFTSSLPDALVEVEYRLYEPRSEDIAAHVDDCRMAVCAVAELVGDPARRRRSYTAGDTSESYGDAPFSLSSEAVCVRYLGRFDILRRGQWL